MSTLLYANTEYFIGDYYNFEVEGNEYRRGITPVTIFDSDEVSMERLPVPENSIDNEQKTYRGNYSGVIQSAEDYFAKVAHYSYEANDPGFWDDSQMFTATPIIAIPTDLGSAPHFLFGPYTRKFQDACEIKYKSSPHAVFTLNNTGFTPRSYYHLLEKMILYQQKLYPMLRFQHQNRLFQHLLLLMIPFLVILI